MSVMMQIVRDKKIPEIDMVKFEQKLAFLATVEEKIVKSANEYLGFGKTASNEHGFKYHKDGNWH